MDRLAANPRDAAAPRRLSRSWAAWLTAVVALFGVVGTALRGIGEHRERAERSQQETTQLLALQLAAELERLGVAATSASGLFAASNNVELAEWRAFCRVLHAGHSLDDDAGIAYAQRVAPGEIEAFVRSVRADGARSFVVPPPASPPRDRTIVRFQSGGTTESWPQPGMDLAEIPAIARALALATALGRFVVSEPIVVAGTAADLLVVCAPVYRKGQPVASETQRREACKGWILVPLAAATMFDEALAALPAATRFAGVRLFDTAQRTTPIATVRAGEVDGVVLDSIAAFRIGDRQWHVQAATAAPLLGASLRAVWMPVCVALALGALLTIVVWGLTWSSHRTHQLAVAMTQDLRESEARLQVFIEHAAAAVAMFDTQMRYIAFSRRWLTDYGLTDAIRGRCHYDVFPSVPERWKETHRRCLAGSVEHSDADPFDRTDIGRQWLRWDARPWRMADGTIGGLMMFTEDITANLEAARLRDTTVAVMERVAANRPLPEILSLITGLAESLTDDLRASVLLLRGDRLHLGAGPSLPAEYNAAIEGIQIGAEVGSCGTAAFRRELVVVTDTQTDPKWRAFAATAARFELRSCWSQPILAGANGSGEPRVLGTLAMYYRTQREPSQRQLRLVHDLAHLAAVAIERLQSAEALRLSLSELTKARSAAEAASDAKSEFLANMSHEIRTPMTAILGYADVLAEPGTSLMPSLRREALDAIRRNGHHLLAIINDVLDISKIEAGKMSVERIPLDPLQAVRDSVSSLRERADAKGVRLALEERTQLPARILGDPLRLRQILLNLIGNAIKFTDRGAVVVDVGCVAAAAPTDAPLLRIEVRDTGIGMRASQCASLFQAFSQADTSTTRRFGGTGLGLRISKCFATMLGGDIEVVSAEGAGSTFTLTIPAVAVAPELPIAGLAPTEAAGERGPTGIAGMRVLLAEDGLDNQRLVSRLLQRAGAVVTVANNGRIAVEALCEDGDAAKPLRSPSPFDLVLLDMQMPEMDGYEAATLLRAKGFARSVVALTANALSGDRERCLAAGCDEYVRKPIDRSALFAACRRAMSVRGDA